MIKKQNYTAPEVEQVLFYPQDAVLEFSSPTSNELYIHQIIGQGTGENDGVAW